jgi:hypothetical protein
MFWLLRPFVFGWLVVSLLLRSLFKRSVVAWDKEDDEVDEVSEADGDLACGEDTLIMFGPFGWFGVKPSLSLNFRIICLSKISYWVGSI